MARITLPSYPDSVPGADRPLHVFAMTGAHGQPGALAVGITRDGRVLFHDTTRLIAGVCGSGANPRRITADGVAITDTTLDETGRGRVAPSHYEDAARALVGACYLRGADYTSFGAEAARYLRGDCDCACAHIGPCAD